MGSHPGSLTKFLQSLQENGKQGGVVPCFPLLGIARIKGSREHNREDRSVHNSPEHPS